MSMHILDIYAQCDHIAIYIQRPIYRKTDARANICQHGLAKHHDIQYHTVPYMHHTVPCSTIHACRILQMLRDVRWIEWVD